MNSRPKTGPSVPSRFIREIPEQLIDRVDLQTPTRFRAEAGRGRFPSFFAPSSGASRSLPRGVHYDYEDGEGLQTGRIVQHPTFGRGRIVKMEGYGESLVLDIMFSGVGLKKIMARYARLKVVG